jgi:hypothetical protein
MGGICQTGVPAMTTLGLLALAAFAFWLGMRWERYRNTDLDAPTPAAPLGPRGTPDRGPSKRK